MTIPQIADDELDSDMTPPAHEPDIDDVVAEWQGFLAIYGDDIGSDITDLPRNATVAQKAAVVDAILKNLRKYRVDLSEGGGS